MDERKTKSPFSGENLLAALASPGTTHGVYHVVPDPPEGGEGDMYITALDAEGRSIYLGASSTTHSVVVELREPSHGLAEAHGFLTMVVDTWLNTRGHYQRATRMVRPDDKFRLAECRSGEHRWNDAPDDALSGRCRVCGVANPGLAG